MWRESSHSLHLLQIKHIEHVDTDMENSRKGLVDERNILSRMMEDLVKEIQIGIRIKPKDRNIQKNRKCTFESISCSKELFQPLASIGMNVSIANNYTFNLK